MSEEIQTVEITDKEALRAFVEPALKPFLLEVYKEKGKSEKTLKEDIEKARLAYKELVGDEKNKKGRSKTSTTVGKYPQRAD